MASKSKRAPRYVPLDSEISQQRTLVPPVWMSKQGFCGMCRTSFPWLSVHMVITCGTCHPPARPDLVERTLTERDVQRLLKGKLEWTQEGHNGSVTVV